MEAAEKTSTRTWGLFLVPFLASLVILLVGVMLGQDWIWLARFAVLVGFGLLAIRVFGIVKRLFGPRWTLVVAGTWTAALLIVVGTVVAFVGAALGNVPGTAVGIGAVVGGCALGFYIAFRWKDERRAVETHDVREKP